MKLHSFIVAVLSYLSNFAKARGVNGSVLGRDGHCVPALILGSTTALAVKAPTTPGSSSTHSATRAATRLLLGDKGLLHLHVFPVFLQLSLFVDLVDGLGALVASPGNPVVLRWGAGEIVSTKVFLILVIQKASRSINADTGYIL